MRLIPKIIGLGSTASITLLSPAGARSSAIMGRLGPLNSLALGRSPFQPPELDENGDFILGPHAHDYENKYFYEQKFDERGHPKNDASRATVRVMQNAQNAVLETVGVVVRREKASKSAWQRRSEKEKIADTRTENHYGIVLEKSIKPFFMPSTMWWRLCLQNRMQVFRSYLDPPVLHIIRSEAASLGLLSFLTNGLLSSIAGYQFEKLLKDILSWGSESPLKIHSGEPSNYIWDSSTSLVAGLIVSLLVFPVKAFALLQGLQLIPSTSNLNPRSFIPFTTASPIQLSSPPAVWSIGTGLLYATSIYNHPFLLRMILDITGKYIHMITYRVILLTLTPRPDRPDKITLKAARRHYKNGEIVRMPGIGPFNCTECLSTGRTMDFWTEIRTELGFIATRIWGWKNILSFSNPKEITDRVPQPLPAGVADRTRALQREMVRNDIDNLRSNDEERLRVQREAHSRALADFGLYSDAEDVDEWLLPAYELFAPDRLDTRSTTTAAPVDFESQAADLNPDLVRPPPPIFDPFTADNDYDREEREGEGRMMASLGFDDPDPIPVFGLSTTSSQEESRSLPLILSVDLTEHSPIELRNPFETASDPSREAVLEEAAHIAPEDVGVRHIVEFSDGSVYYEEDLVAGIPEDVSQNSLDEATQESFPEAPDSPFDRTATPLGIARSRNRDRNHSPPTTPSSTPSEDGVQSVWSGYLQRESDRRPAYAGLSHLQAPDPSASSSSDDLQSRRRRGNAQHELSDLHALDPSASSSDDGAVHIAPRRNLPRNSPLSDIVFRYYSHSSSSDNGAVRNSRPGLVRSGPLHRVTALSVFPAEMFAECAAGLITSALLLPLESLYTRSLVLSFLRSPAPHAGVAALGIRRDVYEMGEWFGGRAGGRLRYAGHLAVMLGIQSCVSAVSWAFVTRLVIWMGRRKGWGVMI